MAAAPDDPRHMDRALALARRGAGNTHPNPMVGAVLVNEGRRVGEGWHQAPGLPHAEAEAIKAAGRRASGATLYVNLEPCRHQGRTPPCTGTIIKAGIRRVVIGCLDPNPLVNGRGIGELEDAGIEVETGVREKQAVELNRAFLYFARSGLPYVTLKLAATMDGRIATASGHSRWITGPSSRKAVHRLRSVVDGVMVGAGTVLADDPGLDAREVGAARQPARIVLDGDLRTPPDARLVVAAQGPPALIITGDNAPEERERQLLQAGAQVVRLPAPDGTFRWSDVASTLAGRDLWHVLAEGGGETAAWLVRERAVRRLEMFLAPMLMGGDGVPALAELGVNLLDEAPSLTVVSTRRIGGDIRITADVKVPD